MIVQWKRTEPLEYVAAWNGYSLILKYVSASQGPPWSVYVDGRQCTTISHGARPARWWTPMAAMESIEAVVNGLVASRKVVAMQRPRSGERITRHA